MRFYGCNFFSYRRVVNNDRAIYSGCGREITQYNQELYSDQASIDNIIRSNNTNNNNTTNTNNTTNNNKTITIYASVSKKLELILHNTTLTLRMLVSGPQITECIILERINTTNLRINNLLNKSIILTNNSLVTFYEYDDAIQTNNSLYKCIKSLHHPPSVDLSGLYALVYSKPTTGFYADISPETSALLLNNLRSTLS